ncbi:hypothetical protein Fmac_021350 [Flemingia macrophylla]|uniref:Protein root UVB sensitive/RUS domain-containing protein n=1 Tax=Flemingia macrophylla TaxID=520843 RepID=A0ABD1LWL7_9FABA
MLRPFNWIGPRMDFIPGIDGPSEVVAARATRLPIYSSFAKEGNLSDLFAKGEVFSTLCNVVGIEDVGNIRVGKDVHKVIKPSRLVELKQVFPKEKFLLEFGGNCINMMLEQDASGEDAVRGWLVAAYAAQVQEDRTHPPGPKALPVIGSLLFLGKFPHRALQDLAKKYGPIMSIKLGQVPTIVVSSAEAAELFLKTHDTVFANRPSPQVLKFMPYGNKGIVFAEYGPYWRNVRSLCTTKLLTASKLNLFAPLRREELGLFVKSLEKAAASRDVVNVSEQVQELLDKIVCKMVLGRSKDDRFNVQGLAKGFGQLVGSFNVADYISWMGIFDLQGLNGKLKKTIKAFDQVLDEIVEEYEDPSNNKKTAQSKYLVDILLSLMHQPMDHSKHEHFIDRTHIKAILLDMVSASFETSATAIEWAMSELLRHPRVMKKLQDELSDVVGTNRLVEEYDLTKLPYLNMVVKETLRLYPVLALVPRQSSEDITIDGYFIKEKSTIIINLWAIGRDPKVWSDNAEIFYPERFENNQIDLKGHDFQLIPFGSGRRGCPGLQLGLTNLGFVLAQLMHCFYWELPFNMSPDDLDMTEKFYASLGRSKPLLAIPTCRLLNKA